jgi:hypothetical protein
MDSCDILLGRPSLFYGKVLHDGMENTYELNKDGQCYRLEPMVEEDTKTMDGSDTECSDGKSGYVMVYSTKEFLKEQKKEKQILAITPKNPQEDEGRVTCQWRFKNCWMILQ